MFNKIQLTFILAFAFGVAYSFVLFFLPKTLSWYPKFASITQAVWFVMVVVILALVRVNGKPLLNAAKHFKEGANWGIITTVGIFSVLGGALSNNDLGIKTWLTESLGPMFSNMSWPVFVFIVVLVCTVVTNFFSNMATGVIVASLTAPFVAGYAEAGINISVVGAAIAYSSMFAYMTYAAAGPAPILLGREGIETKFIWTKGLLTMALYVLIATVLFSLLGVIL
ncbi:MAG: anion permease [Oscillospiraceae bacterium]|nr:anion permease [Oscillospiraceae bacterium]